MKKITAAFMALVLGTSAQAADLSAVCDYGSNTIKVVLDTNGEATNDILFWLTAENADLEAVNADNISDSIFEVREVTGQNGIYSVSLPFPAERGKNYKIVYENYNAVDDIGGSPLSQRQTLKYVASETEVTDILAAVNAATEESILGVLNANKTKLDFSIENDLSAENTDDALCGVLLIVNKPNSGFTGLNQLVEAVDKAYAAAKLKNSTADTFEANMTKYGSVFGIEANSDYNSEENGSFVYKSKINEAISEKYHALSNDITLYQKLPTVYRETLALTVLNNSTRDIIDRILSDYNDIFGLELTTSKYAKLSSDEKINFNKALERKNFQTPADVKAAFSKKLAETGSSSGNNGGGSSGGGGKSSTTYVPSNPTNPSNPSTQPDKTDEKFNDMTGSEWAKEAVYALAEKGIIAGYDDNSFRPNNTITRNEFIKMLICAFNKLDENAEYTFTDGSKDAWYAKYVASAKQAGILTGYEDGRFGDGENITRQDLAVMAYRLAGIEKAENYTAFADDEKISDYAKEAVYALSTAGIINGMGNNVFEPSANATRAQAARIIYLILGGTNNG